MEIERERDFEQVRSFLYATPNLNPNNEQIVQFTLGPCSSSSAVSRNTDLLRKQHLQLKT